MITKLKIFSIILLSTILMGFVYTEERVLFVGDSLTAYKGGWQHQYAKKRGVQYDNISKGGKRTKWMLEQMKKYSTNGNQYNEVVIYGGINDSFSFVKEDVTIHNIQEMVYIAKKMGALPIVVVGYNPNEVIQKTGYSPAIESYARKRYIKLQERMVRELKWCVIVPMDNTINRKDSDDGIHLKASGHRKFAKWVFDNTKL